MKTKTVILPVGRPGAGKTTSSDRLTTRGVIKANALHVEDFLTANNEHVQDRYGNSSLRDDTWEIVWNHVKDLLTQYAGVLIIDMWLPTPERRVEVITVLRQLGISRVICWHFVTPPELCRQRYLERMSGRHQQGPGTKIWLSSHWDSLSRQFQPVSSAEALSSDESAAQQAIGFDEILEINTA